MKTIQYKEIDGFKIVVGAGVLSEDPVESKKLADNELLNIANGEYKKLPELKQQIDAAAKKQLHHTRAFEARGKAKILKVAKFEAAKKKELATAKKFESEQIRLEREYQSELGASKVADTELIAIKAKLEPKIKDIRRKNIAYCEPGANQLIDRAMADLVMSKPTEEMEAVLLPGNVTVSDLLAAHAEKAKNEHVCIDGSRVADYRGCQWFYKDSSGSWIESEVVTALGVTKNTVVVDEYQEQAIEKKDLKPEQQEEIRFQNLTPEQKESEEQQAIESAQMQAVTMRSKLEITGDAKALKKSQDWYASQLAEIESKFV